MKQLEQPLPILKRLLKKYSASDIARATIYLEDNKKGASISKVSIGRFLTGRQSDISSERYRAIWYLDQQLKSGIKLAVK